MTLFPLWIESLLHKKATDMALIHAQYYTRA